MTTPEKKWSKNKSRKGEKEGFIFWKIKAVTFDDFNTLRYPIGTQEDIIYPIMRVLERKIDLNHEEFVKEYFKADMNYRQSLRETLRESLLDDIIVGVLKRCGLERENIDEMVWAAVNKGLSTRKFSWFPEVKKTLNTLRERNYRLGLISNTHWRIRGNLKKEFEQLFDIITLSYEHGYAKPHPSIFQITIKKMKVTANSCLHVGDDPIADIQGARQVGMKTAFIKRGELKAEANMEIRHLGELLTIL
ncbi:MAG: HAD family hydrolase [Promethearchaeota archaeon]